MKKLYLTAAVLLFASPAFALEYVFVPLCAEPTYGNFVANNLVSWSTRQECAQCASMHRYGADYTGITYCRVDAKGYMAYCGSYTADGTCSNSWSSPNGSDQKTKDDAPRAFMTSLRESLKAKEGNTSSYNTYFSSYTGDDDEKVWFERSDVDASYSCTSASHTVPPDDHIYLAELCGPGALAVSSLSYRHMISASGYNYVRVDSTQSANAIDGQPGGFIDLWNGANDGLKQRKVAASVDFAADGGATVTGSYMYSNVWIKTDSPAHYQSLTGISASNYGNRFAAKAAYMHQLYSCNTDKRMVCAGKPGIAHPRPIH